MNVFAWVLLTASAVAAGASWAPAAGRRGGDLTLARAAAAVVLLALAWLLRADTVDYGRWLLLGVLLTLPGGLRFSADVGRRRVGVLALLLARTAYTLAVAGLPPGERPVLPAMALVVGAALAVLVAAFAVGRTPKRVDGVPLLGYAAAVTLLPLVAWNGGHVVVAVAATALWAADLIGWRSPGPGRPRAVAEVLADGASVLLVLGALRV